MYGYYYFDPTYLLLVIGMVLSLLASAKVKEYVFLFTAECAVHRGLQVPMLPDGFFVCRELRMLR